MNEFPQPKPKSKGIQRLMERQRIASEVGMGLSELGKLWLAGCRGHEASDAKVHELLQHPDLWLLKYQAAARS